MRNFYKYFSYKSLKDIWKCTKQFAISKYLLNNFCKPINRANAFFQKKKYFFLKNTKFRKILLLLS